MSEIRSADVDQRGLLKVLGENLYSTPAVAVRELVQNAHDSLTRRQVEGGAPFEPRIDVIANPVARTLTIRDNGAGLTREEIHRYLATIGAGYTRVLRAENPDEGLIGAFGLGFLSAYVVSERLEVVTTSHREPGASWQFRSADGLRYTVDEHPPGDVGTEVVLHLAAEHLELCDPVTVDRLLQRYVALLPHPVHAPGLVNGGTLPWRAPDPDVHPRRLQQQLLEVARAFEPYHEPLVALPVEPVEGLEVRGALWIQGGTRWATSDNRRVSVYVRGMFVSDEIRAVLPEWAGFVGGLVECDALTPTASREDVQRDAVFARVQAAVAEQLVEGLVRVVTEQPEAWRRMVARHADALRGAALADERLFRALADEVPVPTSEGDRTLPEAVSDGRLYVTVGDDSGYELVLHRALGRPVIEGVRFGSYALAQQWGERHGHPVVVLGTESGARAMFPPEPVGPEVQARLEGWFGRDDTGVVATRFAPPSVPVLLVPDRDVLLKRALDDDEADARITHGVLGLARMFTAQVDDGPLATLYVNLEAPVVERLLAAPAEVADPVATVLAAFADASGRRGSDGPQRDLGATLEGLQQALLELLEC